jgi:hypothetical protein
MTWKWTLQHHLIRVVSIADGEQCLNCDQPAAWLFEHVEKTQWWHDGLVGFCKACFEAPTVPALLPPEPPLDTGWIYFIRGGGFVKIGYSSEPTKRLDRLATASPFPLELWATTRGSVRSEHDLHRRFRSDRSHGEWFRITDRIRDYVEALS